MAKSIVFATRASGLARAQTAWVIRRLEQLQPDLQCTEKLFTTRGDRSLDQTLADLGSTTGGKGVFTQELETALQTREVQAAVHSLKDLPVVETPGLSLACIPLRTEPRDVLVSYEGVKLADLRPGARIGTSSIRRSAQLKARRSDLIIEPIRGNVDTRLRKVHSGEFDAIVLAAAGLLRLGLADQITDWFEPEVMLPAPGQGALAVQCRSDDSETIQTLSALEDRTTRLAVTAERAFLAGLGSGCSLPVGALAAVDPEFKNIHLAGLIASIDGEQLIRVQDTGSNPQELGLSLARQALHLGAGNLLEV